MRYVVFFGEDFSEVAEKSRVPPGDTQSAPAGIQSSYATGRQNIVFWEIYNNTSYVILIFAINYYYYYYVTYNCVSVSVRARECVCLCLNVLKKCLFIERVVITSISNTF